MKNLKKAGLKVPEILLPSSGYSPEKWTVIACDQYTSEPDYWNDVEQIAGTEPSTLRLTLPEIYLEGADVEARIAEVNKNMSAYIEKGYMKSLAPGFILVERTLATGAVRKGLMVSLDLETYDFSRDAISPVRATESTILDRLPPRIKIRKDAPVEFPHVMVLIDDPGKTVIEPLFDKELPTVYDFDLMKGAGHLKGFHITDETILDEIGTSILSLVSQEAYKEKYDMEADTPLLFAVGDGNHSLATAKQIWEGLKSGVSEAEKEDHPARYALVELVNLHDESLNFEPIHRVLFNISWDEFNTRLKAYGEKNDMDVCFCGPSCSCSCGEVSQTIPYVRSGEEGLIYLKKSPFTDEIAAIQPFLDEFTEFFSEAIIDYVHGDEVVKQLGSKENSLGLFMPSLKKDGFFKSVLVNKKLPRKSFSMGHAEDKRFYLEGRKIR